ncbi:hypothetical protein ACQUFY_27900 (plasmid) [Robbsia andropogonis]|uniref:hypothetical protein n=1 Tax=Robbsia andropogonis TaxID=28092 RepID=UPI003D1BE9C0
MEKIMERITGFRTRAMQPATRASAAEQAKDFAIFTILFLVRDAIMTATILCGVLAWIYGWESILPLGSNPADVSPLMLEADHPARFIATNFGWYMGLVVSVHAIYLIYRASKQR